MHRLPQVTLLEQGGMALGTMGTSAVLLGILALCVARASWQERRARATC